MRFFRWGLFVLVAGLLVWRITAVNISNYLLKVHGPGAAVEALSWAPDNPSARFFRALDLMDAEPDRAQAMLAEAIFEQPVDGRMLVALGLEAEKEGDIDRAIQAMRYADRLAPMQRRVQLNLAAFWARRGDLEQYMTHLVTVLSLGGADWARLNALLLAVVDRPEAAFITRKVLSAALSSGKPLWWRGFFLHVAGSAKNLDTPRLLYNIRRQSAQPASTDEVSSFVARLQREGEWVEAYFVWLNSLGTEHLGVLGNIFNGGFEYPLINYGYGWRVAHTSGAGVETTRTSGADGHAAVRVTFTNFLSEEIGLGQYLLLQPGSYEFTGRVRSDALQAEAGVQWRIQCLTGNKAQLWAGAPYAGSRGWAGFSGGLTIPDDDCQVQRLYLALVNVDAEEKGVTGALWFDSLNMRTLE